MPTILKSKKMLISLTGLAVLLSLAVMGRDLETIKWFGAFVTGIVSAFNVGQGLADGISRGRTSASADIAPADPSTP